MPATWECIQHTHLPWREKVGHETVDSSFVSELALAVNASQYNYKHCGNLMHVSRIQASQKLTARGTGELFLGACPCTSQGVEPVQHAMLLF